MNIGTTTTCVPHSSGWSGYTRRNTPQADEMGILVTLIETYEHKHFPIGVVDPVEAIKFRMEQQGLPLP